MALPAAAVFEVRTTGNDTNGGGFNRATAGDVRDYSQQDTKRASGVVSDDPATVLLIGSETAVIDESGFARTVTLVGNAGRTTAQAKYGVASLAFDGTGDRLETPDGGGFTFAAGDFTFEGWFRFETKTTEHALMGQWDSASWFFFITGAQLVLRVSGAPDVAAAFVPTLGTWYHLCAERSGTTARLYVNGAVVATNASFPISFVDSPSKVTLGAIGTSNTFPGIDFIGQMDEVRISKGVARYAGAFTPAGPFPRPTPTGGNGSTTDVVANGTSTITSATAEFNSLLVGNIIYLQGGTGSLAAGWYEVAIVASATSIILDRVVATGTGITMNIGGALASLGRFGGVGYVAGTKCWVKAGTYLVTTGSLNVSGGCFSGGGGACEIEGYQTTRGDLGTKPFLQASGAFTSFTLVGSTVSVGHRVTNLKVDGAGLASSIGFSVRGVMYRCEAVNCRAGGFSQNATATSVAVECVASGCASFAAFEAVHCVNCVAYGNTSPGFNGTLLETTYVNCIAAGNTGSTTDGFLLGTGTVKALSTLNCVAYGNGRDGFRFTGVRGGLLVNCIAEANAGWGFNCLTGMTGLLLLHCAGALNTLGQVTLAAGALTSASLNFLTGTSTFFVNAAGRDFALNATVGGGALLRGAGLPGFGGIPTTGVPDIGAAQLGAGSGGGSTPVETATVYVG